MEKVRDYIQFAKANDWRDISDAVHNNSTGGAALWKYYFLADTTAPGNVITLQGPEERTVYPTPEGGNLINRILRRSRSTSS